MRWAVRLHDDGTAVLIDVQSFAAAQEAVFRTVRELLPQSVLEAGPSGLSFHGRCFQDASAPTVSVVSEPSFAAFQAAVLKFLPGTLPSVALVLPTSTSSGGLSARAQQPDPTPARAKSSRPSGQAEETNESLSAQVSTAATSSARGNRVLDRLNNIKKSYASMTSLSVSPHKVSSPKRSQPTEPLATVDVRSDLRRYQQELEAALEEDRKASQRTPSIDTVASVPAVSIKAGASPPSQASLHLMVWGAAVGRGVPVLFNPWQPPSLSQLMGQASALLEQPVHFLSYKKEGDAVEVDMEDDGDVATLAAEFLHAGSDAITVYAGQRPASSLHARSDDSTPGSTPVSYVQLRREAKRDAHRKGGKHQASSLTPITSPIKEVHAPSPPPAPRSDFVSAASIARPSAPSGLTHQLD